MAQDRFKLKLTSLKFISAVDMPAQETAKAVLLKRGDASSVKAVARVVKTTSDELGLVFGWAFTHAVDGVPYHDSQGDHIVEDDVIKIAAEYLALGGDTDEMHDRSPDGKVVFAMPMTSEVAKSFGIKTETTGLMIAIKPSADVFQKFKDGSLTGFSIDGEGLQTKIEKAAVSFAKKQIMLEPATGHTHLLDDCGGASSGYTSSESMPRPDGYVGDYYSGYHSHPWVRVDGVISVGMSAGHTHEIGALITKSDSKSSPSAAVASVTNMTDIEFAKAKATTLKSIASFSPEHLAHYKSLDESDRETFVAKSVAEREVIVKSAVDADPVAHTMADGTVIRKSAGSVAVTLAKQLDAQAAVATLQAVAIEKAQAETERVTLEKRANTELASFAKSVVVKSAIIKAIDGIADEAVRKEAHESLKAANAAMAELGKAKGYTPGDGGEAPTYANPEDATVALEKGLFAFCKAQNITKSIWTDGLDAFVRTPEGEVLKLAVDDSLAD